MEKQVKEMIGGRVGGEGDTLKSFVLLSTTERTLITMQRTSRKSRSEESEEIEEIEEVERVEGCEEGDHTYKRI